MKLKQNYVKASLLLSPLLRSATTKFLSVFAVATLLLTTPCLRAQSGGNQSEQNHLAGTWMSGFEPGIATPTLISFMSDGRVIRSRPITIGPLPAPALALIIGTGHGEWIRTENHQFAATVYQLLSDLTTDYVYLAKITSTMKLSKTSDELTETGTFTVYFPDGNVLFSAPIAGSVFHRIVAGE
jgi:hypothetical protein